MGSRQTDNQSDNLAQFYLSRQGDERNLFQIWEGGGARGDSVTPSTYSIEYRTWMVEKLSGELERHHAKGLLSLGCGNAMVEAELVRMGSRVVGIDAMHDAVELARAKGVEAVHADIGSWSPAEPWSLIYMDGVLGHLYDPATGLRPILERIRSWLAAANGSGVATLIASNDIPKNGGPVEPAPGVNGFHWLAASYLRDQGLAAGFDHVEIEEFSYRRPVSGRRQRAIITARVTG